MSADNYGVVHRHRGGWGLSMGFASDDEDGRELDLSRPYFTAPTRREVEEYADTEYFEYGWSVRRDSGREVQS